MEQFDYLFTLENLIALIIIFIFIAISTLSFYLMQKNKSNINLDDHEEAFHQ